MDNCLIPTPGTKRKGGYREETERIDARKDRGWKSTAQHPLFRALGKPFSWPRFHQLSRSVRASVKWDAYLSIRGTGRIVNPGLKLGITSKAIEKVIKSEGRNRSDHQCKAARTSLPGGCAFKCPAVLLVKHGQGLHPRLRPGRLANSFRSNGDQEKGIIHLSGCSGSSVPQAACEPD